MTPDTTRGAAPSGAAQSPLWPAAYCRMPKRSTARPVAMELLNRITRAAVAMDWSTVPGAEAVADDAMVLARLLGFDIVADGDITDTFYR